MTKLLIVDGMNLLFQMFFGMPSRIVNSKGKAIQGTLGFVGALIRVIKMVKPTHVVVLFDGEHYNARTEISADYKANRIDYSLVSQAENPFSQLQDVYNALESMNIKHCEISEFETDDVIASYVYSYQDFTDIVIASFDSDFFQLISEKVKVLRYRGDKTTICDIKYIKDKYGILPCQYVGFKALTGDTADNIKGADKIGIKTAAALMNQFSDLKNMLRHSDQIVKKSIKESIINNAHKLEINYKLIKLDNVASLPFELNELAYNYSGVTTSEVLKAIGLR